MQIVLKLFYLILSISLNTIFVSAQETSPCASCYLTENQNCSTTCKNIKDKKSGKYEKCKRNCVVQSCNKICKYNIKDNDNLSKPLPQTVTCDYCTRNAKNNCSQECDAANETCLNRCISQTCKNSCSLPAPVSNIFQSENEESCIECKTRNDEPCQSSCGNKSGAIACKVACIERNCSQNCLID